VEFSKNGRNGPVYKMDYVKQIPLRSTVVKDKKVGLKFEYYVFNDPVDSSLELLKMNPLEKGIVSNFVFPYTNEKLPDQFGLIYNGYIDVSNEGIYTFSVDSNDGSRLYIDDELIVENDGWHGPLEKEGQIALEAGTHKIKLLYFQSGGRKSLKTFMKSPDGEKLEIKTYYLNHKP
jgi:hexosaminidase